MLRPVPCSALSEPSYLPTTSSTTSRMNASKRAISAAWLRSGVTRKCRLPADACPKITPRIAVTPNRRMRSSAPSARRSGGKQTSSRMNDVPVGRAPPTEAEQAAPHVPVLRGDRGVDGERGGLQQRQRRRRSASERRCACARVAASGQRNSTSSAVAVSGSASHRAGTPGRPATARSDARSSSSTAAAPSATNGATAAQARVHVGEDQERRRAELVVADGAEHRLARSAPACPPIRPAPGGRSPAVSRRRGTPPCDSRSCS